MHTHSRTFSRTLLIVSCAALTFLGCTTAEDPRGTRVSVRGEVTLDGKPLDRAQIVFRSADGPGSITATGSVVAGKYEIPAERGPLAGNMRVEIRPETIDLAEFEAARSALNRRTFSLDTVKIPVRYNVHSNLEAIVTPDSEQNVFPFELKSR